MQFNGRDLEPVSTSTFTLPRPDGTSLPLQLRPLPLGFHQRLRDQGLQVPIPPTKIARDSAGRPIRDAQGNATTISDSSNPEFLQHYELYHQRVAVLSVVEALASDPNVTFNAQPPNGSSPVPEHWHRFADEVFAELEHSGFTAGDLILLCQEICRISNLLDDHLKAAQANFSSPPSTGIT